MHDEMERVFNVRIKPARDGARPSESVPKSKLQAKITHSAAAHELAYDAAQKPEHRLQKLLEHSEEELSSPRNQRKVYAFARRKSA